MQQSGWVAGLVRGVEEKKREEKESSDIFRVRVIVKVSGKEG